MYRVAVAVVLFVIILVGFGCDLQFFTFFQNPGACLNSVHPNNLKQLIEAGNHRLSQMIVEFYEKQSHEFDNPDSPFYCAAWFLLRNQELPYTASILDDLKVDLKEVLLWASRFGFHALTVRDELAGRTRFLQDILVQCSTTMLTKVHDLRVKHSPQHQIEAHEREIVELWSNIFSPLLVVGTKHRGVPYGVALLLASYRYPAKDDWPPLIQYLSAILHGKAEKSQAEALLLSDLFTRLQEKSPHDVDHGFTLPSGAIGLRFVAGLLSLNPPGTMLSRQWQNRLLTTPGVVIPDHLSTPRNLAQLELGVLSLR